MKYLLLCFAFLSLSFFPSCAKKKEDALEAIKKSGKITVLTRNNAHSYYIYRDEPMGFEYDLAKAFSDYLGVQLRVVTPTWEGLIEDLIMDKGDFIAASMTVTPSRLEQVDFSDGYLIVQQQVILHKNDQDTKTIEDLVGKTVHVRRGTSYEEALNRFKAQGLDIHIKLYDDMPTEELIRMVAEEEIEVTVADSHIALLNRRYYPDAKIGFPMGEPQILGWAVKKGEKALLNAINEFFTAMKKDGTFEAIHDQYFANVEIFDYVDLKKYHKRLEKRLPKYKGTIQRAAREHGFDWRLIAAMIYQESHFSPRARSYTGVRGMMQLTLDTAREMGIKNRLDPKQSIRGGVKYLRKLYDKFDDAKEPDRMLMALASYNVGYRHVKDAQRIAEQHRLDPNSWAALEETLPLLCRPKYYKKSRAGYCRGREPVRYVNRILTYYDILKREAIG
ncbi:MAG: membrane-bound lytic murein transglycosylase MltF [Desulfobacteraceae bacterium]